MHRVRAAALAAVVLSSPMAAQRPAWQLCEVASVQAHGGCFELVAITPDARRMLTIGELGDAILWDLPAGVVRRRFAAPPAYILQVAIHPRDPWAIVRAAAQGPCVLRLDFGTGRYQPIPFEQIVCAFAFDVDGSRAAVLFENGDGYQLGIYPEAALRTGRPVLPDSSHSVALVRGGWCGMVSLRTRSNAHWVQFHPLEQAVFVGGSSAAWRIPLDGGRPTPAPDGLRGFLGDGVPVTPRFRTSIAGVHCVHREQASLEREGAEPCRWAASDDWGEPVMAADGSVAVPDVQGGLVLLGPAADQRRTLCGHVGPVVQMCFDATSRWLASTCGGGVNVLDVATRTSRRLDGTFGVRPLPREAAFLLLSARGVERVDVSTLQRRASVPAFPARCEASVFARDDGGESRKVPWLWQPDLAALWLVRIRNDTADDLVRVHRGAVAVPGACAGGPLRTLELLAGPAASVLAFDSTPLPGPYALDCTPLATVRRFDGKGVLRDSCAVAARLSWARASPSGARIAIGLVDGTLMLGKTRDLGSMRVLWPRPWVRACALEFLDERSALVGDGARLFALDLDTGRARMMAMPAFPGPITQMCVSPDRRLVALACADHIRVLRRW